MIGRLHGIIVEKQAPDLLLDVNGVGYECLASMTTFLDLPEEHQTVTLYTHLSIREDAHTLFAFSSKIERELFRTLLKVNGVGPKLALAIVSSMSAQEFAQLVHANDVSGLTRLPGVGKKTAERLIIEMRDRLDMPDTQTDTEDKRVSVSSVQVEEEAVNALIALGYKPAQASRMVSNHTDNGLSVEEMVRKALKDSLA